MTTAYAAGCIYDAGQTTYTFPSEKKLYDCLLSHPMIKDKPLSSLRDRVAQVFSKNTFTLRQIESSLHRIVSDIFVCLGDEGEGDAVWLKTQFKSALISCAVEPQTKRVQKEANHTLRELVKCTYLENPFEELVGQAASLQKNVTGSLHKGEIQHQSAQAKKESK